MRTFKYRILKGDEGFDSWLCDLLRAYERLTLDGSDYVLSKHTLKDLLAPGGREDATQAPCEDPLGFSFLYDLEF